MASNTYDQFRTEVEARGLDPLPRWSELDRAAKDHCFRVLRRLAVGRALDGGDAFSAIEVEAGLGEDAALRTFLLSTAVLAAAEGSDVARRRDPIGAAIQSQLSDAALAELLDTCWVYRDESMVAWTPLHAVVEGFQREDDEDAVRLTDSRKAWDNASTANRVDWIGQTVAALMHQYVHGNNQGGATSRQVFADQELRRALAAAAAADRISLLSDGAFDSLAGEVSLVAGVEVKLDAEEAYVRRAQCEPASFPEWSADLAAWKPDGGAGETAFAWDAGLAMVVSGGSVAGWLRRCAEALLAGRIGAQRRAA